MSRDSITTVEDLKYALRNVKNETQIYIHVGGYTDGLIEVIGVELSLPKNSDEKETVILECQ
ncbi:MAG: hypothetical protein WC479_07220 [Candidatus Izemoplasmatales bacterium]